MLGLNLSPAALACLQKVIWPWAPSWVPRDHAGMPAPFVLDAANNRGWYNGVEYGSETAFLSANGVSGTVASGIRTFGPYDVPAAPNEIVNGSFTTGTNDWTAFGTGASISAIAGELRLTTTGSLQGFRQTMPMQRKAYRFRISGRRSGSGQAFVGGGTANNVLNVPYFSNASFGAGIIEIGSVVPAGDVTQRYIGIRQANGVSDTYVFDNAFLTEVKPFSIFDQTEGTIFVKGTADSSGIDQVLIDVANISSAQNGDRDYIRVSRIAATGELTVNLRVGDAVVYTQSLGVVANGAMLHVALAWKNATLNICLNGSTPFKKASATVIQSHSSVRFAGSFSGNPWQGFQKGIYLPAKQPDWWLQDASTGFYDSNIWTDGDSYVAGASGVSLAGTLQNGTNRNVVNQAADGATLQEIRDRVLATPSLRGKTLIVWDGSANSYTSVASACGLIDDIIAWHGAPSKIVFIPSVAVGPSPNGLKSSYTRDMEAIRDHIATTGVRTFDPVPVINAIAAGSNQDLLDISAGIVCASLLQDTVHLTQAAMNRISNRVTDILAANGL